MVFWVCEYELFDMKCVQVVVSEKRHVYTVLM